MALPALEEMVTKLPELRAEYERLGQLIAAIEAFARPDAGAATGAVATGGQVRSDTFLGMSTPEAVKKYLGMIRRAASPRDIADAMVRGGQTDKSVEQAYVNVYSALKRLRKAGEMRKTPAGEWGLSEWYGTRQQASKPNHVRSATNTKKPSSDDLADQEADGDDLQDLPEPLPE